MSTAPQNKNMQMSIIKFLIILVISLMVAVTIWAWDLHELFIKEKRANRLSIIQADARRITQKLTELLKEFSELFGQIDPYIQIFLKWLLRLTIKLLRVIGKVLKWSIVKLKEFFQKIEDCNHQVDPALLLTLDENLEMIEKLDGHPYSSPVLEDVYIDHYIATSYKASAAGTGYRYTVVDTEDFERIVCHTIRNFIASKRKVKAYVYIIAATPKYLHFAVTYTPYGWNRLLQIYPPLDNNRQQTPPPALEETIPEEDGTVEENGENEDSEPW